MTVCLAYFDLRGIAANAFLAHMSSSTSLVGPVSRVCHQLPFLSKNGRVD